jgi:hypothetical protein
MYGFGAAWYQDRMAFDWKPPTPQEAEAIFHQFGLTDDFWRLS